MGIWSTIPPERPRVFPPYVFRIVRNLACKVVRRAHAEKRVEALSIDAIMEELGDVFAAEANTGSESEEITAAMNRFLRAAEEFLSAGTTTLTVSAQLRRRSV